MVGVTRYCAHPPEVLELPKIGGHLDPNFEAIVSLEPDLVVVIPSSHENRLRLESLGIRVLEVDQHDVECGARIRLDCGARRAACPIAARPFTRSSSGGWRSSRRPFPVRLAHVRSLWSVTRSMEGAVRSVWAAGRDTFYDGVVQIAGGINAVDGGLARYPELSREGLSSLDPDVVLDVIAGLEDSKSRPREPPRRDGCS